VNESRRVRISRSLFLLALSLGTFAGVNVADNTRYVLLAMAAVAMVISLWLLWTDRGEEEHEAGPLAGRGLRIAAPTTASVVSWAALGIAVG
jgi:hypothetical protein